MKLKLSTLITIIGLIFFSYYYKNCSLKQNKNTLIHENFYMEQRPQVTILDFNNDDYGTTPI